MLQTKSKIVQVGIANKLKLLREIQLLIKILIGCLR